MSFSPDRNPNCPFCAVVAGSVSSPYIVAEAPDWMAFFPDEPATVGHTLVIPRRHVTDFWELNAALASQLTEAARRVGQAVRSAMAPEGLNLITSAGDAAEQTVFHVHLHVLPRWRGDGLSIWPDASRARSEEELQRAARAIRKAIDLGRPG